MDVARVGSRACQRKGCKACVYMPDKLMFTDTDGVSHPIKQKINCSSINVIFGVYCDICEEFVHVGYTGSELKTRVNDLKRLQDDKIRSHFENHPSSITFVGIEKEEDYETQRKRCLSLKSLLIEKKSHKNPADSGQQAEGGTAGPTNLPIPDTGAAPHNSVDELTGPFKTMHISDIKKVSGLAACSAVRPKQTRLHSPGYLPPSDDSCPDSNSFGQVGKRYHDQSQQTSARIQPGQACCLIAGCGKQCIVSSIGPNTTPRSPCPSPDSYGRQRFAYSDQCQEDGDCPGRSCCLVGGCGHECIDTPEQQAGGRG